MATAHLAIDLGASGGRAMLGVLDGRPPTLRMVEAHRFEHQVLNTPTGPTWDLTTLWRESLAGIRCGAETAHELGAELRSVGVDTWGVDWALVEPGGEVLGLPHAYRDPANLPARERVIGRVAGGAAELFARTGIQPQFFNTLFQLDARFTASPALFEIEGATLLLLPDLLHFWLTGLLRVERTNASTTGMLSATTRQWDGELLASLGLPSSHFAELIDAPTVIGPIRESVAAELGITHTIQVVSPATHDTASAVAAVPAADEGGGQWAFLSSGTWSLLGVELAEPITSPDALAAGFTNELGIGGKVRLLRNIAGLWLVQELRRDLQRTGESLDFAQLADLAAEAEPLRTIINPNLDDLAQPGDSIAKLRAHAKQTGQPTPETPGQLARCCFDSLALCYAETIDSIESLAAIQIETLYVVGGGVKNRLLNQLTADATGRAVKLGPSEATAIGNALTQAMGLGLIENLHELRRLVGRSETDATVIAAAEAADRWSAARQRYSQLVAND